MKVSDWIDAHPGLPVTVSVGTACEEALDRLLEAPCVRDIYVVATDGRVVGHLSHRRIAHSLLLEHRPEHTRRQLMERIAGGGVEDIMESHFPSAHPDEDLDDVLHRQLENETEAMAVIDDDGRLVGAIELTVVLREYRTEQ